MARVTLPLSDTKIKTAKAKDKDYRLMCQPYIILIHKYVILMTKKKKRGWLQMQVSLNIQDDVYQKIKSAGIDMQSKINEYLLNLVDKKDDYLNSKQYQEDKAYFQEALEEIESEKTKPLSHTEVWTAIEEHTSK